MLKPDDIYCDDCIALLESAGDMKARLIFADPPFNIGYEYDSYHDRRDYDEYVRWTERWMSACKSVLTEDGSFYVAIGDDYAAEVRLTGRKLGLHLRNWIVWHYTFGQSTRRKFARAHTHIFYFVSDPRNFVFNDDAIRVPSARQLVYNDKRAHPKGRLPDDVWRYSRVCGTFKERVGWHTCQMPEKLLARIIKTSSNPDDLVLDPFAGSGTTLVVAAVLKRHYLGIDISANYVELARKRVAQAQAEGPTDINERESALILQSSPLAGKNAPAPLTQMTFDANVR